LAPGAATTSLAHHLRQLKLPTCLREYEKLAAEAAREGLDYARFLLRLAEVELVDSSDFGNEMSGKGISMFLNPEDED
jgi:hypothetical protein